MGTNHKDFVSILYCHVDFLHCSTMAARGLCYLGESEDMIDDVILLDTAASGINVACYRRGASDCEGKWKITLMSKVFIC